MRKNLELRFQSKNPNNDRWNLFKPLEISNQAL